MPETTTETEPPSPLRLGVRVRRGHGQPVYAWFIENAAGHSVFLRLSRRRHCQRMDGYYFFSNPWRPRSDPAQFDTEWVEFMPWETMWLWQMDYQTGHEPEEMTVQVMVLDEGQEQEHTLHWNQDGAS